MWKRGFTLVELVMVIAVLAILAAIGTPLYIDLRSNAKSSAMKGAVNAIRGALSVEQAEDAGAGGLGDCPATLTGAIFKDGAVPENPVNGLSSVKPTTATCDTANGDLDNSTGWLYNATSCRACANTTGTDSVTGKNWVSF